MLEIYKDFGEKAEMVMPEWQLSCHAVKILQTNIFQGEVHCGNGWPWGRKGKNFSPLSRDRK